MIMKINFFGMNEKELKEFAQQLDERERQLETERKKLDERENSIRQNEEKMNHERELLDAAQEAFKKERQTHVKKVKASHIKKQLIVICEDNLSEDDFHKILDPTGYMITSFERIAAIKKLFGWK